jgi:hypothetical protein
MQIEAHVLVFTMIAILKLWRQIEQLEAHSLRFKRCLQHVSRVILLRYLVWRIFSAASSCLRFCAFDAFDGTKLCQRGVSGIPTERLPMST